MSDELHKDVFKGLGTQKQKATKKTNNMLEQMHEDIFTGLEAEPTQWEKRMMENKKILGHNIEMSKPTSTGAIIGGAGHEAEKLKVVNKSPIPEVASHGGVENAGKFGTFGSIEPRGDILKYNTEREIQPNLFKKHGLKIGIGGALGGLALAGLLGTAGYLIDKAVHKKDEPEK